MTRNISIYDTDNIIVTYKDNEKEDYFPIYQLFFKSIVIYEYNIPALFRFHICKYKF